jgi:hypothetical protein
LKRFLLKNNLTLPPPLKKGLNPPPLPKWLTRKKMSPKIGIGEAKKDFLLQKIVLAENKLKD